MAEGYGAHRPHREWASIIKQDLQPHVKKTTSPTRRNAFGRIGPRLMELRREQFVPRQVSLGLYQRSSYDHNHQTSRGNSFKLALVGAFLADSGKTPDDWEEISASIVKDPQAMLDMYNEAGLDDFSTEDVRSVLSLDAIFSAWFCTLSQGSITLIGALVNRFPSIKFVFLGTDATFLGHVSQDMLKLENQIPLESIRSALVASSMDHTLPGSVSTNSSSEVKAKLDFKNCEHLLHCVYLGMISEGSQQRTRAAFKNASEESTTVDIDNKPLASASFLRKTGINFQGTTGLEPEIKKHFLGATLYVPRISHVDDIMEEIWRNLLAFEATCVRLTHVLG